MQSNATTVQDYLAELDPERRTTIETVRQMILKHLPKGYDEGMQYGMIGYFVPHARYPAGYPSDPKQPLPFAGLASQKNYCSLYLMAPYGDPKSLQAIEDAFSEAGKKLDMGKGCIRFKKAEDLPLEALGELLSEWTVTRYIQAFQAARKRKK
jgi:uncharacterized protein YdhG (YjbR/CyaY superfamily)